MLSLMLVAVTVAGDLPAGTVIAQYNEPVMCVAWTKSHQLLIFTTDRVREWPRGRSARLHRSSASSSGETNIRWDSLRNRAIGPDFVIDARTLESKPLDGNAVWNGAEVLRVDSNQSDLRFIRHGKKAAIAKGWLVAGISHDGRYAVANKEEPFDDVDTSLLRLDPASGRSRTLFTFPQSSNDHSYLDGVEFNRGLGTWIVEMSTGAGAFTRSFLAGPKLREAKLGIPMQGLETSCSLEWVADGSPWTLATRQFFFETDNGSRGSDANCLDLWNVKTGRTIRLASSINRWKRIGFSEPDRWTGPDISVSAIDWKTKRLAYVVQSKGAAKVMIRSFDL